MEEKLKKTLIETGLLTEDQVKKAEKEAKEGEISFEEVLLERDLISDEHLGQIKSDLIGYPFINLKKEVISEDVLNVVPEIVAKKQKIISFAQVKEGIKLAMADPENLEIKEFIEKKTGEKVLSYYATEKDIEEALSKYRKGLKEEFKEIIKRRVEEVGRITLETLEKKAREVPAIKIIDTLLEYGYRNKASDIHIEPQKEKIVIRFRVDGVLHDVLTFPKDILDLLIMRVKILARLRTDEHRIPQDGRWDRALDDEHINIRVSVVPIASGEKVVLRLLSEKAREFSLEELGLRPEDYEKARKNLKKPWGMILATGPTGCGKTTTLYSLLKILNTREVNISTIEDPIEYSIPGINQIQVDPKANLTFATGLKSIIRQDPNIIMVGEIRDPETAGLAINAAMTGHLVLSTLHTNDAATTLPRLLDMKVEPFLIASTINIALAQRLVRKICLRCIESYEVKNDQLKELKEKLPILEKIIGSVTTIRLYQGKGCQSCNQVGYSGRLGIFEVLEINEKIRELITKRATSEEIKKQAVSEGMKTMLEDGIKKALTGITTIDEVLRVTRE